MNKIIILFLLFTAFCFSQNFNAGIICGINTSQVSGDNLSGFNKIGPRMGGFVNYPIGNLDILLELQYLTQGSKKLTNIDDLSLDFINNYHFHLEYIGIPMLVSMRFQKNIKIELGTSINFLIRQKEEIDFYIDNSREVDNIEFSILAGVNYQLNKKIILNTRLTNSLIPVRAHASGETYKLNKGQYNTGLSFSLYYYLTN